MELRHLRYFLAVAEHLNFGRAAEALHTAQPSLSQQIRTLETYLGIPLLARNKRKVELTAAGLRFLDEARLALAQTEKAVIRARQSEEIDRLRLGFTHGLIMALLPQLQPLIQLNFPGMQMMARSMLGPELEQALKDDELDMVFTNAASKEYDISSRRLFGQSLVAVFPAAHAKAAIPGGVSLAALRTEKIVVDATSIPASLLESLTLDGRKPDAAQGDICEAGNFFEALGLIMSGHGIGLFESSFLRLIPAGLVTKKLEDNCAQLDVVLLYRSSFASANKLRKLLKVSQEMSVLHS